MLFWKTEKAVPNFCSQMIYSNIYTV